MRTIRVETVAQYPFNTWSGSSSNSTSGVSSSTYSPVVAAHRRPLDRDDLYEYSMRQDISWFQSVRTDESWLRMRRNHEERQILGSLEWVNEKLSLRRENSLVPIRSLNEFHDGLLMIYLLECLYKCELKKELKCRLRLHKIRNFDSCLRFMRTNRGCECVGIQAYELADCANIKLMLGFLFLIKHDFEYKYLNEISEVRMRDEDEVFDSIKEISSGKMEDSGLNMGLDTDEAAVVSSYISSATNADEQDAQMYFESSSDSSSIYSLTSETLKQHSTSNTNEEPEPVNKDSAYSQIFTHQLDMSSSTSSTSSLNDDLVYAINHDNMTSSPIREVDRVEEKSDLNESFIDDSEDENQALIADLNPTRSTEFVTNTNQDEEDKSSASESLHVGHDPELLEVGMGNLEQQQAGDICDLNEMVVDDNKEENDPVDSDNKEQIEINPVSAQLDLEAGSDHKQETVQIDIETPETIPIIEEKSVQVQVQEPVKREIVEIERISDPIEVVLSAKDVAIEPDVVEETPKIEKPTVNLKLNVVKANKETRKALGAKKMAPKAAQDRVNVVEKPVVVEKITEPVVESKKSYSQIAETPKVVEIESTPIEAVKHETKKKNETKKNGGIKLPDREKNKQPVNKPDAAQVNKVTTSNESPLNERTKMKQNQFDEGSKKNKRETVSSSRKTTVKEDEKPRVHDRSRKTKGASTLNDEMNGKIQVKKRELLSISNNTALKSSVVISICSFLLILIVMISSREN